MAHSAMDSGVPAWCLSDLVDLFFPRELQIQQSSQDRVQQSRHMRGLRSPQDQLHSDEISPPDKSHTMSRESKGY
jgi:hypothetical protein